jgi:hypothetical protein
MDHDQRFKTLIREFFAEIEAAERTGDVAINAISYPPRRQLHPPRPRDSGVRRRGPLRGLLIFALLLTPAPLFTAEDGRAVYTGRLIAVYDQSAGMKPPAVVLVSEGRVLPILQDEGGRRFFKDRRLFHRDYRIIGRVVGGAFLQVLSVQSVRDGKPHEIYYWCDICAIRRTEMNDCECCGAPMELRETPIER